MRTDNNPTFCLRTDTTYIYITKDRDTETAYRDHVMKNDRCFVIVLLLGTVKNRLALTITRENTPVR